MWEIGAVCVLLLVLLCTHMLRTGRPGMPPGPAPWPFMGNLHIIYSSKQFHLTSQTLGKRYNGMFSLQYGAYPGIMITELSVAREALIGKADVFSDRVTHTHFGKLASKAADKGVLSGSGETWKRLKRLTLASMRHLRQGKASLEQRVYEEVNEVIAHIEQQQGRYFTFDSLFNKAVTNIICALLMDKRYAYDDPVFVQQIDNFNVIIRESGFRNIFQFLPWWTFVLLPIVRPGCRNMLKYIQSVKDWINQNIQEHRESFDEDNLRDFVDLYLNAEATEKEGSYSDKQMFSTILEMFAAGSETTSTTLLWAFIYLTKHPHIQHTCRQHIRQTVGEHPLEYRDRGSMPYVEATICEILRRGNTVPITIPHRAKEKSSLGGYTIPKDTIVNVNMYAIHMQPALWSDPYAFKPERFLDQHGKFVKHDAFVPFGIGKRACLGESLAKMELWLFIGRLLQKFEFQAENPEQLPTPETSEYAVTLIPRQFSVRAISIL